MSNRPTHLYEFGPFVINPAEHTLLREGQPLPLRPKVFDTLLVFVENSGRLIEKDELVQLLWPGQFIEDGNLNKNVSLLRRSLGQNESGISYIETVPKRGYRFNAKVRITNGGANNDLVADPFGHGSLAAEKASERGRSAGESGVLGAGVGTKTHTESIRPVRNFTRRVGIGSVLAAGGLILLSATGIFFDRPGRSDQSIRSIAVLPFTNESGDPDSEYLSDGISESLINKLSQLKTVKVIARSSSFRYKNKPIDVREVGRTLGVEAVVTGRVTRRADQLVISVELVSVRDGTQLWGTQYERELPKAIAVHSEIAREITTKLNLQLTEREQQQLAKREVDNPQAVEFRLRGRFHLNQGTTENGRKAIEYFLQAISVEPKYALAYAELFEAYNGLINDQVLDPKEFTPKAEAAARQALELDDSLAEAHAASASVKMNNWDWVGAEAEIKRAIEINPNSARVHGRYASYLAIQLRGDEALAEGKRARELDPLAISANAVVIYGLLLTRQHGRAMEAVRSLLELNPGNPFVHTLLGETYTRMGDHAKASEAWQEAIRLGDDSPDALIFLSKAYAMANQRGKARAILAQLQHRKESLSPVGSAMIYIALGDLARGLDLLESAYAAHDQQLIWLGVEPGFDPLRTDPRFQALARRVGLPPA